MSALDKLIALDEAASGPEPVPELANCTNTEPCPACQPYYDWCEAREKLNALSHLLRPAFEVLKEAGECCGGRHGVSEVLAQLEECI